MCQIMSIKEVVNHFQRHISNAVIGRQIGVTADQVYKYGNGTTRSPGDKVADAIYDNLLIAGERVVLDVFRSEDEYLDMRRFRERVKDGLHSSM